MLKTLLLRNHNLDEADNLHTFYDISFYINCAFDQVGLELWQIIFFYNKKNGI